MNDTETKTKPSITGNYATERFNIAFYYTDRPKYQSVADVMGYEEVAQAIRNAAKVGANVCNQDPNEFLRLLNLNQEKFS